MSAARLAMLRERLEQAFAPQRLELIDDSHKHAGHAGAAGGGHFTVRIVASAFAGKSLVQRHRLVYNAVADMMGSDVHALSIDARAPDDIR